MYNINLFPFFFFFFKCIYVALAHQLGGFVNDELQKSTTVTKNGKAQS